MECRISTCPHLGGTDGRRPPSLRSRHRANRGCWRPHPPRNPPPRANATANATLRFTVLGGGKIPSMNKLGKLNRSALASEPPTHKSELGRQGGGGGLAREPEARALSNCTPTQYQTAKRRPRQLRDRTRTQTVYATSGRCTIDHEGEWATARNSQRRQTCLRFGADATAKRHAVYIETK